MFTIFSRIMHYGFVNFWRNGWPSAATVAVMVVALITFNGLIFFNVLTGEAVKFVQDKIDISVYFKTSTSEDQILNIKKSLETLSEVDRVEYVSTDDAMTKFKDRYSQDETISRAVNELNSNPFEASLNIKARKPDQYASIAQYLTAPNLSQYLDNVSYSENHLVIDRLVAIINNINRGGMILTIILALIAGLVVLNTIRLAIYSNRDEIGIMRAVGASNALVRGPYMVEGIISGIISAFIATVIIAPATYFTAPYFSVLINGFDLFHYFYTHIFSLFIYLLLVGVFIGSLSSYLAVRRYLKN